MHVRPLALAAILTLGMVGCAGKPSLPENYTIGEDGLPALGSEEVEQNWACTTETDQDTDETTYVYTEVGSGKDAVREYVDVLVKEYGCWVVDEEGVKQEEPDFAQTSGTVLVGKETAAEDGVFQLKLQWDEDSCSVTPTVQEGEVLKEKAAPEPLTMEQAAQQIEELASRGDLGTSGDLSEYSVSVEEGYVMVDDQACFRINLYDEETHSIQGTYLLTLDGEQVYVLDRDSGQVSRLIPD
ncbi:MAG: hypothetical protein ACOX7N_01960 [Lawsonibacter sp.]|jgi:hypothetical protein